MYYLRRLSLLTILLTSLFIVILPAHAMDANVNTCDFASLQAAVTTANTGGGTITFNCSGTITFTSYLTITADVIINENSNTVIFDGDGAVRHFWVNPGATLTLNDFTLQNGFGSGFSSDGGSLYNNGTLTLTNITLSNNTGTFGGAVFNSTGSTATFNNVTFANNTATSSGGGLRNRGTSIINGGSFSNNLGTGQAINSAAGSVSSQNVSYINNTCAGTITDNGGNVHDAASTGCPGSLTSTLTVAPLSCSGINMVVNITAGDPNFNITATSGPNLPLNNVGIASHTINGAGSWVGVTVTELTGDLQSVNLGDITCHTALSASAVCIGADLQVTITAGDGNFVISADSGTLNPSAPIGTQTLTGPRNETNLTVTELGGNVESMNLGAFNCFASSTLTATAVCVGADLQVTITNGNAPFTVNVTNTSGVMSMGSVALGTYIFTGPDTFANISVVEESGDLETLPLAGVTCTAPIVPVVPVAPVVLSPDTTALGCDVTANIDVTADNTYCRVLMRDGAVVGYSGAIPQNLVNLGVIFAVDVYQLRGGQAVNEFAGYQQICLGGTGRLFYMDSRQSPRSLMELATESINGMTCGWIPAPGTLILTK